MEALKRGCSERSLKYDPDQVYFSDGLSEDVITELSRFRELVVIARNSTFSFRGQSVDVREIGRVLVPPTWLREASAVLETVSG
jgi:TolB-like protein